MAIEVVSVTKLKPKMYRVTIQDTGDQIGTDELGNPIYRTYSAIYNANAGLATLKTEFENQIKAQKSKKTECENLKATLQTSVSAINTSKL